MIATTTNSQHFDAAEVKLAASGRWREILTTLAGIPDSSLDGNHHPCPWCGGTDRFRAVDIDAGAVYCNQCFRERNGDGFSVIQKATGCSFPEAVRLAAEYLGLEPSPAPSTKKRNGTSSHKKMTTKKRADPAAKLQFIDWVETFANLYCRENPGITPEALRLAGARMAYYYDRYTVIALPIYGPKLLNAEPVGWIVQDFMGGTLPRFDKSGKVVEWVKRKITYGSQPGVVGDAAARGLADPGTTTIYKMEGVSDALAMQACLLAEPRPGHVVVTTANGATERWSKHPWLIKLTENRELRIIHDCDEPGQRGAEAILADVAHLCTAKNFVLPYPVQKNKGPDFRDYKTNCLSQGVTQLLTRLDTAFEKIEAAKPTDSRRSAAEAGGGDEEPTHYQIAQSFLASTEKKFCFHSGDFWAWNGNYWESTTEDVITSALWPWMHAAGHRPTKSKVGSILAAVKNIILVPPTSDSIFYLDKSSQEIPAGCDLSLAIPTKTQLVLPRPGEDAADWPVIPRDHHVFTPWAHSFDFEQTGGRLVLPDCPGWENHLHEIFRGESDQILTLQMFAGYLMTGLTNQQKFLILSGPKRSGKSLVAKILRLIVGSHLSTAASLIALASPHGLSAFVGKRLAVMADERRPSSQVATEILSVLLSLIGEDEMLINPKHKQAFTARLQTRVVVLSNETSPILDEADALTARLLLLRTRRSFAGAENVHLEEELKAELPGIVSWAMRGLEMILAGGRLQSPDSTLEDLESIRQDANPLSEFFSECLIDDPVGWVPNDSLHDAVRRWADERQLSTIAKISPKRIGTLLLNAKPHVTRERKMHFGKLMRGFSGINLQAINF